MRYGIVYLMDRGTFAIKDRWAINDRLGGAYVAMGLSHDVARLETMLLNSEENSPLYVVLPDVGRQILDGR